MTCCCPNVSSNKCCLFGSRSLHSGSCQGFRIYYGNRLLWLCSSSEPNDLLLSCHMLTNTSSKPLSFLICYRTMEVRALQTSHTLINSSLPIVSYRSNFFTLKCFYANVGVINQSMSKLGCASKREPGAKSFLHKENKCFTRSHKSISAANSTIFTWSSGLKPCSSQRVPGRCVV